MEPFESFEHAGCEISFHYDEDARNPREEVDCYNGIMLCRHGRYDLGDVQASADTWEDLIDEARDLGAIDPILPLYLIDHSGLAMRTGPFHEDPGGWDSGRVGVIFTTAEKLRDGGHDGIPSTEDLTRWLTAEVSEYSAYLEGDVFGYVVECDGVFIDSVWGYYDWDASESDARATAIAAAEHEQSNRAMIGFYASAH